jgi:hypothetical protein
MPGMKMVMKNGKKVPDFAADGKGPNDMAKLKRGGPAKKAAAKKAAAKKKKAPTKGKKKMAYGGAAKKPMGMMYGGKPVYKSRMN